MPFNALWYFRGPLTHFLQLLPAIFKTVELEASKERIRVYFETRGAPEPQPPLSDLRGTKPLPYKATERLVELRDSYREQLIDLTDAKGKGRHASLRKLALLAVDQKKLDPDRADLLVQFEDIAQDARFGLIPEATARAVVTVSGSLLDSLADRPR